MNQEKDFEPLISLLRERISLAKNKRLRAALSERGDPAARLSKELPAAVAIEWEEEHPDREPPVSLDDVSDKEIASLRRRVVRRLEKQGDEGQDKIIRAARRAPAEHDEDEAREVARQVLLRIGEGAQLTPSEMRVYELTMLGTGEEEIAELLSIELESVARTKRRLVLKLKESAAKSGFSEQLE